MSMYVDKNVIFYLINQTVKAADKENITAEI